MDERILKDAQESVLWSNWRIQMTIPSVLAKGEEFALRMTAFGPDYLPSGEFPREIVFGQSAGVVGLPKSVRFSPGDGGCLTIGGLKAVGPKFVRVVARPEKSPSEVWSNPAWVQNDPAYRVYWGDLHVHTTYSDCHPWACKDPEFLYAFAREAAHLDFASAADHLRGLAQDARRWPTLQQRVRENDRPGSFVPILAFESSHAAGFGGDINAYYLGTDGPLFWLDREDMQGPLPEVPLETLWDFLDKSGREYITISHHTGRARKHRSWADDAYKPEREPLFEIYSMWGSSQCRWNIYPLAGGNSDEVCYYRDALKAGCRYGVIASSDNHMTLPGSEAISRNPAGLIIVSRHAHQGLAAVRAKELTREALWKSFNERNCYATTFARTLLDVKIGDLGMGQAGRVSANDPLRKRREVRVDILSNEWCDVVLVRNGEEVARKPWRGPESEIVFVDEETLDRIAIRGAKFRPEPFVFYYVRLETHTHQSQWSSPIWLEV